MKLFQYYDGKNRIRAGVRTGEGCFALPEGTLVKDVLGKTQTELQPLFCGALDESGLSFAPVLTNPEKILCIGLNYNEHIDETGLGKSDRPGFPPVFCKFGSSLLGGDQVLCLPKKAQHFDYEAELVIVMGETCKEVTPEEAPRYIAGYTVGNDFSARDMQLASSQWTMGKACDGFAPVGPYYVPAEELNPGNLEISCKVNGVCVQKSSTRKMIYSCAEIVSYLSDFITLQKGDLIFTGTPSGVILGKPKEEQVWLKSGDEMIVEIEGIGSLRNRLV